MSRFDPAVLGQSVLAVPPLARDTRMRIAPLANARLVAHLRAGGVTTYLYGGNANFYHLGRQDYAETLGMMRTICPADGLMIPSAGPDYGKLLDQAAELERAAFPLVMILPASPPATPSGAERAVRDFVDRLGRGAMLYIKSETIPPHAVARLVDDGVIDVIKYAVPRTDLRDDRYLDALVGLVPRDRIVSGFGEMPAIGHMRHFGLAGFTAGCVCLAPRLSSAMLAACRAGDWDAAAAIQQHFVPLERLRDHIDPIGVLHYAVDWAGLVDMGEILPALSPPAPEWRDDITAAARQLLAADAAFAPVVA